MRFEWDDQKALENVEKQWRYMKNKKDEKSEPVPEEVELVVTQEDYEAGLKRGWTDDDMLKPGRYKMKRGGFLARHPELKLDEKKRA